MKADLKSPFHLSALITALLVAGFSVPLAASAASVTPKTWATDTGYWNVDSNWDTSGIPATGEVVLIDRSDARVSYLNNADPLLGWLTIDSAEDAFGKRAILLIQDLNQPALSTSRLSVGDTRFGQTFMATGTLNGGDMTFASGAGSWGSHWMQGDAIVSADSLIVGGGGFGSFFQTGNSDVNIAGGLALGTNSGGYGHYAIADFSTLKVVGQFTVGSSGVGNFIQTSGIVDNTTNALYLGEYATGVGSYQLSGGELKTGGIGIGEWGGSGGFDQSGGIVRISNDLGIARQIGSNGVYTMHDGQLFAASMQIGIDGNGSFAHYGGQIIVTDDLNIASGVGSGKYELDDPNSLGNVKLDTDVLRIGTQNTGSFLQKAGMINIRQIMVIAENPGVQGSFRLDGGILNTPALFVGDSGKGSFLQTAGINNSTDLAIAVYGPANGQPLSEGRYKIEGGELNTHFVRIGNEGRGHFVQTGGVHSVQTRILDPVTGAIDPGSGEIVIANVAGSKGTYELQGGVLNATRIYVNGIGTGGDGTLLYSGGDLKADIENRGDVELSGPGTRTIDGNVFNEGTWKVSNTTAVYTGTFTNAHEYRSDPSINTFSDLIINENGYLVGGAGDQFLIGGKLESYSYQDQLWDTQNAQLIFIGGSVHEFYITGLDMGGSTAGYVHNFGWGDLEITSGSELFLIDSNDPGGALYVGTISGLNIVGDTVENIHGNGLNVYYAPWSNPGLNGQTYLLADGGTLAPVPEPETWAMLLAGLGLVGFATRAARDSRSKGYI